MDSGDYRRITIHNSEFEDVAARTAAWFDYPEIYDAAVAEAMDGAVFVEVGSFLGRSSAYLADRIRRSGKRITLFCVDHFKLGDSVRDIPEAQRFLEESGGNYFRQFLRNISPYRDIVIALCGDSLAMAEYIPDGSADFVFIDASHDESSVRADIAAWKMKLKPGGQMAGHDFDLASVRTAVDEAFPNRLITGRSWLARPFDDLLIFAQNFMASAMAVPACPFDGIRKVDRFSGLTLHRSGPYQVQLWIGEPNANVPEHRHPNVDTIQIYLSGQIYLRVNGVPVTAPDRVGVLPDGRCNLNGAFTRIRPEDIHSFTLGPAGGSWMTVEKWLDGNPTSTELDWEGEAIGSEHKEMLPR